MARNHKHNSSQEGSRRNASPTESKKSRHREKNRHHSPHDKDKRRKLHDSKLKAEPYDQISHRIEHENRSRPIHIKSEPDDNHAIVRNLVKRERSDNIEAHIKREPREAHSPEFDGHERQESDTRRYRSRDERYRNQPHHDRNDTDFRHQAERRNNTRESNDRSMKQEPSASGTENRGKVKDKEKPNFGLSGKLAEDTNTFRGVVIKYNEPEEARKPRTKWRFYIFKGEESLPMLPIHRQSAYLLGRDRVIADIPIDHPSCSKQHAVLQYRLVPYTRDDGTTGHRVRPYIIDLESSNGTFVNYKQIEARRYVELKEQDVLKFGFSSREYVILHENSKVEDQQEDEGVTEAE